jgi:hypothetical protein
MGLSRLDNFLKNVRGEILYVDPSSLDSTDSIENQGNSLARPFKTIQRALIEASRFSYQKGENNDRFGRTTILLYPGEHVVDNRPGWIPVGDNINYLQRSGVSSQDVQELDINSNFDLNTPNNILYKLNSVHGGVIIPRGTSIVGLDLRKTKVKPLYVPNPENNNIERSAIFRVTGSCYFWQFTILDSDPNGQCYKDYTPNKFTPNFSHNKLTVFEFADGVNPVKINDDFINFETTKTDLDLYYEKIGLVYGNASGRPVPPELPTDSIDIQTKVDEYRIVGSRGSEVGISSIFAGNGNLNTTITVTLDSPLPGLAVDTPIQVEGISDSGYDGQYLITNILNPTQIQYKVDTPPDNVSPSSIGATLNIVVDSVTSASPYVFNCTLRSVFGMCGMLADGSKADGFKSMVVAQYTGIGLQKDNNAFIKYNTDTGVYEDTTVAGNENIYADTRARYKPNYKNFHIKCINNAFIQIVSVFAIGYAEHFVAESGGDQSITNSNSNFGAKSLVSKGFREEAFRRDDVGYITHIIPPRQLESFETPIEFSPIDISVTKDAASSVGLAQTSRLYLYGENNEKLPPQSVIDGYRIGARENDTLNVLVSENGVTNKYQARIIMHDTEFSDNEVSSEKKIYVAKKIDGVRNSITNDIITLDTNEHQFKNGESIRILSDNGDLPTGLDTNEIYYAITSEVLPTLGPNQIKIAKSLNRALDGEQSASSLPLKDDGGLLSVVSRVSDKNPGDVGHPIQFDVNRNQWYINVSASTEENSIFQKIKTLNNVATSRSYVTRVPDTRSLVDTIYRVRYVIPSDSPILSRPPIDGYVIQESSTTPISDSEIQKYFNIENISLTNSTEIRKPRFISGCVWDALSKTVIVTTELPNSLREGSQVEIKNVQSSLNTDGLFTSGFNGTFIVNEIIDRKTFRYSLSINPGTFLNDTSSRNNSSLPYYNRKKYAGTYQIYRVDEVQKYVFGKQDGIYHLVLTSASNKPQIEPFTEESFSQPIQNLYPQKNRDNPKSDPKESVSFALSDPIGQVVINNPEFSITKETTLNRFQDSGVGIGITDIVSDTPGIAHTIFTNLEHSLNRITKLEVIDPGQGYGSGSPTVLYNARLVGFAASTVGDHATVMIGVNESGSITNLKIMDGGSAYAVGNQLRVVGVGTTSDHVVGVVSVTQIYDNTNDILEIDGIYSENHEQYNGYYRISGVKNGNTRQIEVISADPIGSAYTTGIGSFFTSKANALISGPAIKISSIDYTPSSGIATIVTESNNPFQVDNTILIGGVTSSSRYNGEFVIKKAISPTVSIAATIFEINIGITTEAVPAATGEIYAYTRTFGSNGGNISKSNENVGGRFLYRYAGISVGLQPSDVGPVTGPNVEVLTIANAVGLDLRVGDYLLVNEEIMRVKSTIFDDNVQVFRGLFGTRKVAHPSGSVITRIDVEPIELRRNSIIRASNHTFEYLGFGPGNYSTSLPERQDRSISVAEELLAQSTKIDGGTVVYTGMNSDGDFYVGNKKVNSSTGKEEIFDSPIPTVTGEDINVSNTNIGFDVLSPLEISVNRSIHVEGGTDSNIVSSFDGPVVFNNKITSNSPKGIEANSLFLQGNTSVSRRYSVSDEKPDFAGNPGDVIYRSEPNSGGTLGWVYTTDNIWEDFSPISVNNVLNNSVTLQENGNFLGIASVINFTGIAISITAQYDANAGIATVDFYTDSATPPTLRVIGLSTFLSEARFQNGLIVNSGISTFSRLLNATAGINISGRSTFNNDVSVGSLNVTGISTLGTVSRIVSSGNISAGSSTSGSNTRIVAYAGDLNNAGIEAHGNTQGTGYLFVGQSTLFGGGVVYNGDANPAFSAGEIADTIGFYRKNNGVNETVFSYPYNSNTVTFRGSISVSGDITSSGNVSAVDYNSTSDINLKKNIEKIENPLNKLDQLNGVKFSWKETDSPSMGVIAQEVETVLPELVNTIDDHKTVNYNGLIALLIESVKAQQEHINRLEKKLEDR